MMMLESDSLEAQAHQAAMANPIEAMKALRVTTQTGDSQLSLIFMSAYEQVKGGCASNAITQSNVSAAIRDWKVDKVIPEWLARACVLADRQSAQ